MHVVFAIEAIHAPGVKEDQQHKNVYRSLLRKPKSQLKSADANRVQFIDEQNAESV